MVLLENGAFNGTAMVLQPAPTMAPSTAPENSTMAPEIAPELARETWRNGGAGYSNKEDKLKEKTDGHPKTRGFRQWQFQTELSCTCAFTFHRRKRKPRFYVFLSWPLLARLSLKLQTYPLPPASQKKNSNHPDPCLNPTVHRDRSIVLTVGL